MKYLILLLIATKVLAATPEEIILQSDKVKNPDKPFQMMNHLTEYDDGKVKSEVRLQIFAKEDPASGQFKNVVIYKSPPRDTGKIVLLNGTTMWFYDPSSKASVRISPQQRLVGQASEGDVVTVNFAHDYKSQILDEPTIQDADHQNRNCWHLDLKPSHDEAIYNRIEYWVEKGTFRPIKGKFYSDSGRLLKISYYHRYESLLGHERPVETIIIDAVNPKLVTTMNFSGLRARDLPDNWFQRDYLSHLKIED